MKLTEQNLGGVIIYIAEIITSKGHFVAQSTDKLIAMATVLAELESK